MTDRPALSEEQRGLAAEFALGLLDGPEELRAQTMLRADRAFAAEVWLWQQRISDWYAHVEGEDPPADMLARIERTIGERQGARQEMTMPVPIVQGGGAWKMLAIGSWAASIALVAALAFVLLASQSKPEANSPGPVEVVSQISRADGTPLLSAVYERDSTTLRLRVADIATEGKLPELWLIPEGKPPQSLGLLHSDRMTIQISDEVRALLNERATLAITVEDIEGAPHDAPSGPIIGTAELQAI